MVTTCVYVKNKNWQDREKQGYFLTHAIAHTKYTCTHAVLRSLVSHLCSIGIRPSEMSSISSLILIIAQQNLSRDVYVCGGCSVIDKARTSYNNEHKCKSLAQCLPDTNDTTSTPAKCQTREAERRWSNK